MSGCISAAAIAVSQRSRPGAARSGYTPTRRRMHSQPRWRRLSAVALARTALAPTPPPAAHAGIWTKVDTPTTQTITAIDYQGGDRFWYTTSNAIYKRNGSGWTTQV